MPAARRRPPAAEPPMTSRLVLQTPLGALLDEKRVRLLEAIGECGSLTRAARAVPLSYKGAWDALQALQALAPEPLVQRATGGAGGGGTRLTAHGRQLVAMYREMARRQQSLLDRLPGLPPGPPGEAARTRVRRAALRSSARNQWPARVQSLADRGGLVDVQLVLGDPGEPRSAAETVVAVITPESAAGMALRPGSEVFVLLKAPGVRVRRQPPRRAPGRNVLRGTVAALRPGEHHTSVTLRLGSGRELSAVMPRSDAAGLAVGEPAHGVFDGDQLVLVGFG